MWTLSYNNGVSIKERLIPERKEGESLIQVVMTCLCRTDNWIANGDIPVEKNRIIGHEFSGKIVDSDIFSKNQTVAVFPFISCKKCIVCKKDERYCPYKEQLGWHRDGSFSQFICVPDSQIFPVKMETEYEAKMFAYAEPVAASLGVVEHVSKEDKVFIWGNNRIAELTRRCLKFHDIDVEMGFTDKKDHYDIIIETVNNYNNIMTALKPGGTLIIKSRRLSEDNFSSFMAVNRSITMKSVGHADFKKTLEILPKMDFDELWGKTYSKKDGLKFLDSDKTEKNKSFLNVWE